MVFNVRFIKDHLEKYISLLFEAHPSSRTLGNGTHIVFYLPQIAIELRHSGYVLHIRRFPMHVSPVLHEISSYLHETVENDRCNKSIITGV